MCVIVVAQQRDIWNNTSTRFDYDSAVHLSFPPTGSASERRRLEIASCGFGFIKDRLAEFRPTWRSDLVDFLSPVCMCVNRVAVFLAYRSSAEREPAAARFPWSCWRRSAVCISLVFRATPGGGSALFYERLYMISTNWPLPDFDAKKERVAGRW